MTETDDDGRRKGNVASSEGQIGWMAGLRGQCVAVQDMGKKTAQGATQSGQREARRTAGGQGTVKKNTQWRSWLLWLVWLLICALPGAPVQAQSAKEYEVKAAFLFNFMKFVEWPAGAFTESETALIVGVLGDDPFGSVLDLTLNGKTINGRPLVIKRLKWGQDLRVCHVLFISSSEQKHLAQILSSLHGVSVLTISELEQFNQQGGIIKFILEEQKVGFEINAGAAEQVGIKISSRLLALAKAVRGGRKAGGN